MPKPTTRYKGWSLVETGRNYYHACKGSVRATIGSARHGDLEGLYDRFRATVDKLEGMGNGTED